MLAATPSAAAAPRQRSCRPATCSAAPLALAPRLAARAPGAAALRQPARLQGPRRSAAPLGGAAVAALPASLRPRWEESPLGGAAPTSAFTAYPLDEPTTEAFTYDEPATETDFGRSGRGGGDSSPSSSTSTSTSTGLKPLPRNVEGVADDVNLHNPLQRMERLGTAWFGTIFELDGVCVEYECGDGPRSWQALAAEEGKPPPPLWALKKADGMKNDQVVTEVFNWTRNPVEARRLGRRREELLAGLLGGRKPLVPPGVELLMDILQRNQSPLALVSSAPEVRVLPALEASGLLPRFDAVVTGDDVYRGSPDPEGFLYAAQKIARPPLRCVVIGSSNQSIEAAHEVGMKCVALAGRQPVYELSAADLVVRDLAQLSFVNLKQLFAEEETVARAREEGEEELEEDEDSDGGSLVATQVMDWP